jgi:hypothetical protein
MWGGLKVIHHSAFSVRGGLFMFCRKTINLPWFLRPGVVVTSLVLAGGSVSTAHGQVLTPPAGTIANGQAIAQLKSIRTVLHNADHDYQGYRAKAVHQVTEAIHALEGIKNPPKKPHKPVHGQKSLREPQAVSDTQLSQAIQQLQTVQTQLGTSPGNHTVAAGKHISQAIQDLQTALKIK